MPPVIQVQHLTKDYGQGRGVFDLSFSVEPGEVMGFLGPNGAGKTTTIRHLMGFLRPDGGTAAINGLDCFAHAAQLQKTIGYLPGEPALLDDMTGRSFLLFLAKLKGLTNLDRMQELMERFALDGDARIKKLSKGTKQKVALVAAFMTSPDLLILDEPTSGLDPLMQGEFVDLVLEEKRRGATILLSSHMFEEVERTCDRTVILRQGRVAAVEGLEALQKAKRKHYTVTFHSAQDAVAFADGWTGDCAREGNAVHTLVTGSPDAFLKAVSAYPVADLELRRESLEELFLHYYGGEDRE